MARLHFAFEISENSASLARMESGVVTLVDHFVFEGKKEFQYTDRLSKCIKDNLPDESSPDEVTVSWVDPHATLIPISLFKPEMLDAYFQACFSKKVPHNELDYNRIFNHSVVTVYEIPLWVKSFFVSRFPRVNILHVYSHLIKASNDSPVQAAEIRCLIYPDQMILCLTKAGGVIFSNAFEVTSFEDVLYYLSFALQQQSADFQEAKTIISLAPQTTFTNTESLHQALKQMPVLNRLQLHFDALYPFKIQEFCV